MVGRVLAGVGGGIAAALVVAIILVTTGGGSITSPGRSGEPSVGPTDGMETDGFHPPGSRQAGHVVVPVQLLNGASAQVSLPAGTDLANFNYDPQPLAVTGGPAGTVGVSVLHSGVTSHALHRSGVKALRALRASDGHKVTLYRFPPPEGLPVGQPSQGLVFQAGGWFVDVTLPLATGAAPTESELQVYADHIAAHQNRAGFPVLDVSSPLTLVGEGNGLSATFTDWTVVPSTANGPWLPNQIWLYLSPCGATGPLNANGFSVLTSDTTALPGVTVPPQAAITTLCNPSLGLHFTLMGTPAFRDMIAGALSVKAFSGTALPVDPGA